MGTWLPMVLPFLVTAAWLLLPGMVCTLALRLRPAPAAGLAPLASLGLISAAAVLAPRTGLSWGPLPVLALTVLVGGLLWAARLLRARRRRRLAPEAEASSPAAAVPWPRRALRLPSSLEALTFAGMALGAMLMARLVMTTLQAPDALSQSFDNIFHQSAVRAILDGAASPSSLDLLALTADPGASTFYPAAWHDTVSLVLLSIGGQDVALATNAMTLAVCALVWPAGAVLLSRSVLPSSLLRLGLLPAGVLSAALPMFPRMLIVFGVLYPNLLGMALLPGMLVLLLRLLGIGRRDGMSMPAVLVLGLLGGIGTALGHPNAAMSLLALAVPVAALGAVGALLRAAHPRLRGGLARAGLLTAAALGLFLLARGIWPVIRPPEQALVWEPDATIPEAIGRILLFSLPAARPAWSLAVLLLLGAYATVRHRRAEMLAAWGLVAYLFVAVTAWPDGPDRDALVGVWYNDPYRLAAMFAIPALPILALGVAHLSRALADVLAPRLRGRARRLLRPVIGLAAVVLCLAITQGSTWMTASLDYARPAYRMSADANVLSPDELALIERLPQEVPADAVLIVNAWNGSSLAYPYTGIATTRHHTLEHATEEDRLVEQHLRDAAADPTVCEAVTELGAGYVLDFGEDYVNGQTWDFPGLRDLGTAEGFTLVDSEGAAALYRIDACTP
ncbi:DUF6541 family protein [Brachybacterium hainanense]|uniref:DUF6541 family protein n=1 Tax=Brachybacterium hainanense TaxID=1541174 RepID=A0ABV6RIB1_9MICO